MLQSMGLSLSLLPRKRRQAPFPFQLLSNRNPVCFPSSLSHAPHPQSHVHRTRRLTVFLAGLPTLLVAVQL